MIRDFFITGVFIAGMLGSFLLTGTVDCHAENWVVNNVDIPNKNVEANYYDSDSVKVHDKTLSWTEKFVMTDFGVKYFTKHLSKYPACQQNIVKKGDATHHQIDLQIKAGKFRQVAKRNYNKANELLCTDQDMGAELDKSWQDFPSGSPMYYRYNEFVTKYKIGDI